MELDLDFMQETFLLVWQGAGVTLSLTALALIFAAPVGFYFAVLRVRGYRVGGSIANITVNLIKGTSLAFLMTVKDITAVGKVAASYGYNYIEAYLDVFLVYLVLCTVVQLLFAAAERRVGAFRGQN